MTDAEPGAALGDPASPAEALVRAYPERFGAGSAQAWVTVRRQLLTDRSSGGTDRSLAVSSGCAATGARSHARRLADDAAHALRRLDAGLAGQCEVCGAVLDLDRLDSAPSAVRCTGCVPAYDVDTRWCR